MPNMSPEFKDFTEQLKANGFKVYAPVPSKLFPKTTYCFFVKNDQIGYMDEQLGFNFGTVHKPCRQCGTGFGIHRDISHPTIQMAEDSLIFAPSWSSGADRKAVVKYKNWEDYLKIRTNQIMKMEEI